MDWKWLTLRFATYRGYRLAVKENFKRRVKLYTANPAIGRELGFAPHPTGVFMGWVPLREVTELTKETLLGELDGKRVWILGEEGDQYYIQTREGRTIAAKWGLEEVDRGEWGGCVPKSALSRVWHEVNWLKRPE